MVTQRLRRSGGSLAVTIPKDEIERLGLHEGDLVAVQVNKIQMRIELPADVRAAFEAVRRDHAGAIEYLKDR